MPARYTRFWILLYNWNSLMCILDKIVCVHNCLETAYIYVFLMTVRRLYVGSCVHIWKQYCEGVTVLLCFTEKQLDCPVNLAVRVWTTSALPRPWWLIKKELFSPNQHGCNCMRQKWISCHSLALWKGSENTVHVFFSHIAACAIHHHLSLWASYSDTLWTWSIWMGLCNYYH